MNLPNKISIARICLIPLFVLIFFLNVIPFNYGIAAIIFVIAAGTDFIDGRIARKRNLVTNLGKFLDPIADKVLVATAFILMLAAKEDLFGRLGNLTNAVYIIVTICVCIILARELIISAFRQIAAANGIIMAAEKLGKYKTAAQDACLFIILLSGSIAGVAGGVILWIGLGFFALASVLTIVSGMSYVLKNKQVLKDTEK
jgi:CDP-diacylglycerol--glycerol-3-phosphate 3-phosphatidyltransferase